jgi:hypothetical protein
MTTPSLFPEITTPAERREARRNPEPEATYISMGAGVQSTTLALLVADGTLPAPRYAVFADTGWEPHYVYEQLDRLDRAVLQPAGIELVRVGDGNIRDESIDRQYPMNLPLYTRVPDSNERGGLLKRQCTSNFKLAPIFRWVREQLGGRAAEIPCRYCDGAGTRVVPWFAKAGDTPRGECSVCRGTGVVHRVGPAPTGLWMKQWIGFSTDEIERVAPARVPYAVNEYPLLDLGMSRDDCLAYLDARGWGETAKSACIGCPFHNDAEWRDMRDNRPADWADAVEVDHAIRTIPGSVGMRGKAYLHAARVPLDEVNLGDDTGDDTDRPGCNPFGCRSGDPLEITESLLDDGLLF